MNKKQEESVKHISILVDDCDIYVNTDNTLVVVNTKNIYHVGIRGGLTLLGFFFNGKFYDNGSYTYR